MGLFDAFRRRRVKPVSPELQTLLEAMTADAFPNGDRDIQEGGCEVRKLTGQKLSQQEAETLFWQGKMLTMTAADFFPEKIKETIAVHAQGRLTETEIEAVFQFVVGISGVPAYSGGDGSVEASAVVINHTRTSLGVRAEYQYLEEHFGQRDQDWTLVRRAHGARGERYLEWFILQFPAGETRTVYFDITAFFGKR